VSQTGVHQGCPLGPVGFALGIHSAIERVQTIPGLLWQTWYLDDGIIIGDCAAVTSAFHQLQTDLERQGLCINPAKCELWGPGAAYCTSLADVRLVPWDPKNGITVLGVPINFPGSSTQTSAAWDRATGSLQATLDKVTGLADAQTAHHLLRKCLDACKVNHLLRASDTYACEAQLHACDGAITGAFEDLVAHGLTVNQKAQASLPLSVGGCGVRTPTVIRPAARISALATYYTRGRHSVGVPDQGIGVNSAWIAPVLGELKDLLGASFDPLTGWSGQPDRLLTADTEHLQQKWWSASLGRKAMTRLLDTSTPRDQARLLEQAKSVVHAFMAVPPNANLHYTMPSDQYKTALRWWLGVPLNAPPDGGGGITCPGCTAPVDAFGDHLLCCRRNNFVTRHMAVQDTLALLLQEGGQGVTKEVQIPISGSALRPADLLVANWSGGRDTAVDVTVCHAWQSGEQRTLGTTAQDTVSRERWRNFLKRKEADKHTKYDITCRTAGWSFMAMAFGTWGGTGPECAKLIHQISKRAASWQEGELRASKMEQARMAVGWSLMTKILEHLNNKNFLS
jgi:hypothetical protein